MVLGYLVNGVYAVNCSKS